MYEDPRYKFFKNDKLIYLADFCFHYPCNTYLHLAYGIRFGILKFYKFVAYTGLVKKDEVETHYIPVKYLPHEDICAGYKNLMLRQQDVKSLKRLIAKFSKFTLDDFRKYDFCSSYNISKIVPQLAYVIAQNAKKDPELEFSPNDVREAFYSKEDEDKLYSRFPGTREEWEISASELWPKSVLTEGKTFSSVFLKAQAITLMDNLMRSGLHDEARLGYLLDFFFPPQKKGGLTAATKAKFFIKPGDPTIEHAS